MSNSNEYGTSNSNSTLQKGGIVVVSLALMIALVVTSLRGIRIMSQQEFRIFAYLLFATFLFLIPAVLIRTELGTAHSDNGSGIYTWVKEAYNKKTGFVASSFCLCIIPSSHLPIVINKIMNKHKN